MPSVTDHRIEEVGKTLDEKLEKINSRLKTIEDLIIRGNIRLESLVSQAIEREMVTQDSFDTILKLLIGYGKKKGWTSS